MTAYTTTKNQIAQTNTFDRSPAINRIPLILIVEDNEDSRLMLKILLEMWKYRVSEATDGIEAVSLAKKIHPDLILMDVKLPKIDGFEATRRIRESEIISRVPIVILSACAEMIYRRSAALAGADEYLVKPLDFELLEITLEKYVCRQQTISRGNP